MTPDQKIMAAQAHIAKLNSVPKVAVESLDLKQVRQQGPNGVVFVPDLDARLCTEHAEMSAMLERVEASCSVHALKGAETDFELIKVCADFRTMKAKRQQEEG